MPVMKNKTLTLSIVIPVYNEERHLNSCLRSIARQTEKPDEVIVVDNNSTDKSMAVAAKYPFARILREPKQHQVYAQKKGFDSAKSDILGRIDGDSILPRDWVHKVKKAFENKKVVAVTGGADPYDVPLKFIGSALFHGYIRLAGLIAGTRIIWGANCAIRRSAWRSIKPEVLMRPDIWEDYDMSFCLKGYGKIRYIPKMKAGVSFRSVHTSFTKHVRYQFRSVRTFYFRTGLLRLSLFIVLWTTTFIVYPLAAFDDWLLRRKEKHR